MADRPTLESIAKERWEFYDQRGDMSDGGSIYGQDRYVRDLVKNAAPRMLDLLLDQDDYGRPLGWIDKRDALLSELRKKVETNET